MTNTQRMTKRSNLQDLTPLKIKEKKKNTFYKEDRLFQDWIDKQKINEQSENQINFNDDFRRCDEENDIFISYNSCKSKESFVSLKTKKCTCCAKIMDEKELCYKYSNISTSKSIHNKSNCVSEFEDSYEISNYKNLHKSLEMRLRLEDETIDEVENVQMKQKDHANKNLWQKLNDEEDFEKGIDIHQYILERKKREGNCEELQNSKNCLPIVEKNKSNLKRRKTTIYNEDNIKNKAMRTSLILNESHPLARIKNGLEKIVRKICKDYPKLINQDQFDQIAGVTENVDLFIERRRSTNTTKLDEEAKSKNHIESENLRRHAINKAIEVLTVLVPNSKGKSRKIVLYETIKYLLELIYINEDLKKRNQNKK